jgi:hypothetical protein
MNLFDEMAVDLAISEQQAKARYGITPRTSLPDGLLWKTEWINFYRNQRYFQCAFLVTQAVKDIQATQLRHLAGTAAMRWQLGAQGEAWHNLGVRVGDVTKPDAIWETGSGDVAIEYDVGGYSPLQIAIKRGRFELKYQRQIWGTPLELRAKRIRAKLKGSPGVVLVVPWC